MRLLLLLGFVIALPAWGQAPYLGSGQTGVGVGVGYTRSVGGSNINALSADAVATLTPRVEVGASLASAFNYRRLATAVSLTATAYPLAGPQDWVGPSIGVSYVNAGYGGRDGCDLLGAVVAATRREVRGVQIVPQVALGANKGIGGNRRRNDVGWVFGAAVGVIFPRANGHGLILEPAFTYTKEDNSTGLATAGGTVRVLVPFGR